MRSFDTFTKEHLESIVEPFLEGATAHITPIKYQVITPDIYALLFRTTGRDQDYFFVSLEYDHLADMATVERVIREWSGAEVQKLITPKGFQPTDTPTLADVQVVTKEPYFALLALIDKPRDLGYWSEHVVLKPGDHIVRTLKDYLTPEQMTFVRELVGSHTKTKTKQPTTNTTEYTYIVYANPDGKVEVFYNWS